MTTFDIVFIGHMCFDEIVPFQGATTITPGSAVLCGAITAARIGKQVAVVTKLFPGDEAIVKPMRDIGITVWVVPAAETTHMKVVHPVADVDVRQMKQLKNAGRFIIDEIPDFQAGWVHLAGVSDQEFDLPLVMGLKARGYSLSVDMQSFVRQVEPDTRAVVFRDVPLKRDIVRQMDRVKLDVVEAEQLTGTANLPDAATIIASWGCEEVIITQSDGVLAHSTSGVFYEKFSNSSTIGRTGRGDTTFAAYLARRSDHNVDEALRFAAALASIKMEAKGPFSGTLDDVLRRLQEKHSRQAVGDLSTD